MDFQSEKSFGKLRLRAFQPYHQILCMSKHVEDVEDRSNTPKGCNAMYVEDVEDAYKCVRINNVDSNTKYSNYIELRIKCSN